MFIFNFKSCKDFIYKFCFLVLLSPLIYTIFSLIVIVDCNKTKFLKYVFYPIHKIYEPDKKYICELKNLKKKNKIIFLGDSSNLARENPREKGISDLISEQLNQDILTLSYGAANSSLFEAIIDKSPLIDYSNIKYFIITFNYTLFSTIKFQAEENEFIYDKLYSEIFYNPIKLKKLINYNKLVFAPEKILKKEREKDFFINNKKVLMKNYQTKAEKYYYMYNKISDNDESLIFLENLSKKIKDLNAIPIIYLTPINFKGISSAYNQENKYEINSKEFLNRTKNNLEIIKKKFKSLGIIFIDLSLDIDDESIFFEKNKSSTHLNYEGRKYVSQKVSDLFIKKLNFTN